MVTAKKVFWTEPAKLDLQAVFKREESISREEAISIVNAILISTEKLETNYNAGTTEPLLSREKEPYKYIKAGFYKIVYSVVEETVVVEMVYHQRLDPVV